MLEDKLKRSKQKSSKVVLVTLIATFTLVVIGGLLTAELILTPKSPEGGSPQMSASFDRDETPTPTAQIQLVQPRKSTQKPSEEDRSAFKSMLLEYESNIKYLIEAPEFAVWDTPLQARLLSSRDRIMEDFGTGDYIRAREELAELVRQAKKAISERDAAVEESLKQTRIALNEGALQEALSHFPRAEGLAPHSHEVLELEPRVAVLPQVVELLEQVHSAQTQGDIQSELQAWQKIARLDPVRGEAKNRIASIQDNLFQQNLSLYLQKTMAAIEASQPDIAQTNLDKARKMAPKREEIAIFQREIDILAKGLRYKKFIRQARAAEAKDDWSGAFSSYQKAAALNRSSSEVVDGINQAQTILEIHKAINDKLAAPYRLSTKVGEKQALNLLKNARGFFEISPSMSVLAKKLETLLQIYTTPVRVRITSDGKTFVQVKGVGKVGKVTEKVIQIRPGRYTFEGKRDGFISKAKTVEIPPSDELLEVHVVCENSL